MSSSRIFSAISSILMKGKDKRSSNSIFSRYSITFSTPDPRGDTPHRSTSSLNPSIPWQIRKWESLTAFRVNLFSQHSGRLNVALQKQNDFHSSATCLSTLIAPSQSTHSSTARARTRRSGRNSSNLWVLRRGSGIVATKSAGLRCVLSKSASTA